MPSLVVISGEGERTLQGAEGLSVMQVIRTAGQPNFGECSGSLACATCHVVVDPAWAKLLAPASDDEEAMLDSAFGLQPTSRLSCQIRLSAEIDGIRMTIP